ncbi:YgaP family membrane protein [Flaviaesturariibacter terrae]
MKKNMSVADRVLRVVLAGLLALLFVLHLATGALAVILLAIGILLLTTSVLGFCPLYALLGIETCHRKA